MDGQLEWEVEQILGVRRRRNQLQYLIRWKGFSDAHDSWEPMTHINADQLIRDVYKEHPSAIRKTAVLKNHNQSDQIPLIKRLAMSTTPSSTIASPFIGEFTPLPPSPPLSLEERITDTPSPLPLLERISEPEEEKPFQTPPGTPGGTTTDHSPPFTSPPPFPSVHALPIASPLSMDTICPDGYEVYNPRRFPNHAKYGQKIVIDLEESVDLDLIKFEHNYVDHQHYVMAVTRCTNLPTDPYGWPLQATEFIGPSVEDVDKTDLTSFHTNHADQNLVDIGLYNINNRGLIADVDRLWGFEEEQVNLLERQRRLEHDKMMWGLRVGPVCNQLIKAKARSCLQPYLIDHDARIFEPNPAIPHPADWPVEAGIVSQTISIQDALQLMEEGHCWLPRPWYHDEAGLGSTTMHHLMVSCCIYCLSRDHSIMYCPHPHHLCDARLSCIVPTYHRNFGIGCPHTRYHYLDMGDNELIIPDDGYTSG